MGFSRISKAATNQHTVPTCVAAEWFAGRGGLAITLFLQSPEAYAVLGPVGHQACGFCFVEDFHALSYLIQDHSLRLLEQFLQSVIPLKRCVGLEQGAERKHSLNHAECVCYLVDQAEPASNISFVLRCREAPDCTEVLLAGPNAVTCYLKSSELNSVCSEYELLWVEGNAASVTQV